MRKMRVKGFIFTLDASIALFFAVALAATLGGFMLATPASPAADMALQQLAQDALSAMDKNGTLNSTLPVADDGAAISAFVSSVLPPDAGARVNVTVYAYKGNPCPNDYCKSVCDSCSSPTGFCACKTFSIVIGAVPPSGVAVAQRFFADSVKNKFGLAKIEVWWK